MGGGVPQRTADRPLFGFSPFDLFDLAGAGQRALRCGISPDSCLLTPVSFTSQMSETLIRRFDAQERRPEGTISPALPCTAIIVPSHGDSISNTDLSLSNSASFCPL